MERLVQTEHDRKQLVRFLEGHSLPMTVTVLKGKHRTLRQNKLQRLLCNEISEQGDMTPEEVRGYCKLMFGVPILRHENDRFCEVYDRLIKPMSYEDKWAVMMEPLDLPVTRIMTTRQKTAYLDNIYQHFSEQGMELTHPEH